MSLTKKDCAVFTIVHNEKFILPIWLKYYSNFFPPEDIYILDHDTTDGSTNTGGFNRIKIHNQYSFDCSWMLEQVKKMQCDLLDRYNVVIFNEVDELLTPHPNIGIDIKTYAKQMKSDHIRATGYHILHNPNKELELRFDLPLFDQRSYYHPQTSWFYNKVLLSRVPIGWSRGFHDSAGLEPSNDLILVHLHAFDAYIYWKRKVSRLDLPWCPWGLGMHNKINKSKEEYLEEQRSLECEPLPDFFKQINIDLPPSIFEE